MNIDTVEIESQPNPGATLIVLHGLGADAQDFVPFCEALDLGGIGAMRFVLPSAPVMPVSINGGYRMRAWYDILPVDDARREDEASLRQSHELIDGLIAREIERGIGAERIVLMGFSQGCAMALMVGLRQSQRLGGIIALSGYLPLLETTATERSAANQHTPIFMAHGRQDDVVSMGRGEIARDYLRTLGYSVDWHDYPMAHNLCLEEMSDIRQWLLTMLA